MRTVRPSRGTVMYLLAKVVYDGELSATAYLLLACMGLILIGGFAWCFYKAISATSLDEEQLPDSE